MAPRPLPLTSRASVRRACAAAGLVALLAGCGGGGAGTARGRLHGTVTRGPTRPVCTSHLPCAEPASGARLTFTSAGGATRTVVAAKDGEYSVSLAPGVYGVAVWLQPIARGSTSGRVHIAAGQDRKRDFQIDTGLR